MSDYASLGPPPPFAGLDQVAIGRLQTNRARVGRSMRRFRGWDYEENLAEQQVFTPAGDRDAGVRISVRVQRPVGSFIALLASADLKGNIGLRIHTNVEQGMGFVSAGVWSTYLFVGNSGSNYGQWTPVSSWGRGSLFSGQLAAQDAGGTGALVYDVECRLGRLAIFPVVNVTEPGFIDFWTYAMGAGGAAVGHMRNVRIWAAVL